MKLQTLDDVFEAARRHADEDETPDHEVGDLQDALKDAWELMTEDQRTLLLARRQVDVDELFGGEDVVYAIGDEDDDPMSVGMWAGPHDDLDELLKNHDGRSERSVVFRFEGSEQTPVRRWNPEAAAWGEIPEEDSEDGEA